PSFSREYQPLWRAGMRETPIREPLRQIAVFAAQLPVRKSQFADFAGHSNDDVDELPLDDDHLANRLALGPFLDVRIGKRRRAHRLLVGVRRDAYATAQLAVDLHDDLDLVPHQRGRIGLRPG